VRCNDTKPAVNPNRPTFTEPPPMRIDRAKKYTATMETSCGKITVDLDPKAAPKTVNNFVFLAKQRYFDGLTFHRVVKDFVIQGGDPTGTGSGGPGYEFEDELPQGTNVYKPGVLAMANAGPNTNGSQFFIVTGNGGLHLTNSYSVFGQVTGGLDVAQKLESFSTGDGPPSRPLYILSITITEG
jgi:cyclophilin family peptidyl-prolyl cis-trans isomerase